MPTVEATEGRVMPKVTLYVREADGPIWDRARKLAGDADSLSSIVTEALTEYVPRREAARKAGKQTGRKMKAVELEGIVFPDGKTVPQKVRFVGALLATKPNVQWTNTGHARGETVERKGQMDVYLTKGGILVFHEDDNGRHTVHVFKQYTDFEKLHGHTFSVYLKDIAAAMGHDFTVEID